MRSRRWILDDDDLRSTDEQFIRTTPSTTDWVVQGEALKAATESGYLRGSVDVSVTNGAARGARRLVHEDQFWAAACERWFRHCARTMRPCVELTIFGDDSAQLQMRSGARAWVIGKRHHGEALLSLIKSSVLTRDYRPWQVGQLWVSKVLPVSEATMLANDVIALDRTIRFQLEVDAVHDL